MSRIGKKVIKIPPKTETVLDGQTFTVKGLLGSVSKVFKPEIVITIKDDQISLEPKNLSLENRALWGTYASSITNMVKGVNSPYVKKLIIEGIGFKSEVKTEGKGNVITLSLGFSHPVKVPIPDILKVTAEKNLITVSGVDKEAVGQFAASIRALKKSEPYKGKGIRYEAEVVKRKQGKKTV